MVQQLTPALHKITKRRLGVCMPNIMFINFTSSMFANLSTLHITCDDPTFCTHLEIS